jgi:hypothetical protein
MAFAEFNELIGVEQKYALAERFGAGPDATEGESP